MSSLLRQRLRRGLIAEAKTRFAASQASVASSAVAADGSPVVLGAPISPSPRALIDEALGHVGELAGLIPTSTTSSSSSDDDGGGSSDCGASTAATTATLVDLGCGDGRWILAAAERYRVRCVGVDINADLVEVARGALAAAAPAARARVELRVGDMFDAALGAETAAVIVYLYPQTLVRMAAKLEREAPVGCAVLSVGFKMAGWERRRCLVWSARSCGLPVYLYRNPGSEKQTVEVAAVEVAAAGGCGGLDVAAHG